LIWAKALLFWLVLAAAAFAMGALRAVFLEPRIGKRRAHWIGTLGACAALAALIGFWVRSVRPAPAEALRIGLVWMLLTLAFETVMVVVFMRRPWRELLEAYDVTKGQLWPLVPLTVLLAPWLLAPR